MTRVFLPCKERKKTAPGSKTQGRSRAGGIGVNLPDYSCLSPPSGLLIRKLPMTRNKLPLLRLLPNRLACRKLLTAPAELLTACYNRLPKPLLHGNCVLRNES